MNGQTTALTTRELIGVDADARFRTGNEYKDLVTTIDSGKFSYKVTIGTAENGLDLGTGSFTADADDDITIILFGQEYKLKSANLTGTKSVVLERVG